MQFACRNRAVTALGLLLACLFTGCATYRFGTASLYRSDIRTVHVPVFASDSFRRGLGERLTEAVVKEIERRTPYKVVGPAEADSELRGRLSEGRKGVLSENANDEPRNVQTSLAVQVQWVERRGQPLAPDAYLPLPTLAFGAAQSADLVPEAGQSITTAQQAAIEDLARQIVGRMEMAW